MYSEIALHHPIFFAFFLSLALVPVTYLKKCFIIKLNNIQYCTDKFNGKALI